MMHFNALAEGFILGITLIVPIGPQNAFVLKQGLRSQFRLLTAFICFLSDALLIVIGALGFGRLMSLHPLFISIATLTGILFLLIYASRSLINAFNRQSLEQGDHNNIVNNRTQLVILLLSFSLLNPHAYLDLVIMMGAVSSHLHEFSRDAFALGAAAASLAWFFTLVFGATILRPLFAKAIAWRLLDLMIAILMTSVAIHLMHFWWLNCF